MSTPTSAVVLGCAAIAGLYEAVSPTDARAALESAWTAGIRRFDTAPHYGVGQSEERLGEFLCSKPRDQYTVSTKIGRLLFDDPTAVEGVDSFFGVPQRSRIRDYSADGVRRSLEDSLDRLGLDYVDTLLVHDPEDYLQQALAEAAPALASLRDEGVIRSYGVGTNHPDVAEAFVRRTDVDLVMIAGRYTLLDRRAEEALLPTCFEAGVEVVAAAVLNSGLLVDPHVGGRFNYEPAPAWLVDAAVAMADACDRFGSSVRAAALQFPVRHPAVRSVVSGAGTVEAMRDTAVQLQSDIPEGLWSELDGLVPDQSRLP